MAEAQQQQQQQHPQRPGIAVPTSGNHTSSSAEHPASLDAFFLSSATEPSTPVPSTPASQQQPPAQSTLEAGAAHHPEQDEQLQREIPASQVRSGLSDMERHTTHLLQRLENLRFAPPGAASNQMQQRQAQGTAAFLPAVRRSPAGIFASLEQLIAHTGAEGGGGAQAAAAAASEDGDHGAADDADDTEADDDEDAAAAAAAGPSGHTPHHSALGAFALPALDDITHLALLTHTLSSYIGHGLDPQRLPRFAGRVAADAQRWLAHMFRFHDAAASQHETEADALLRAAQLALLSRFPAWLQGGLAAVGGQPVFYVAAEAAGGQLAAMGYVCRHLGLPQSSVRKLVAGATAATATATTAGGRQAEAAAGGLDAVGLQRAMATDLAAGRQPLMVVVEFGGGGQVQGSGADDFARVQAVCRAAGVWMHCRGHSLAALAVAGGAGGRAAGAGAVAGAGQMVALADSMELALGSWLGLPNLPVTLLHRPIPGISTAAIFEADTHSVARRLSSLTLWTTLQALGRDSFVDRLLHAFEAARQWYEVIETLGGSMRILSRRAAAAAADEGGDQRGAPLFDSAITSVVFQFDGHAVHTAIQAEEQQLQIQQQQQQQSDHQTTTTDASPQPQQPSNPFSTTATTSSAGNPFEEDHQLLPADASHDSDTATQLLVRRSLERCANSSYFDKLNSWLAQNMERDCPDIDLQILDLPAHGTCLRFCPFELSLSQSVPERQQLLAAAEMLASQCEILRATVRHRGTLQRLVAGNAALRIVPLPDWAGLGGVRYVPGDGWERLLTGDGREELNRLNVELVETLRATDNAFSLGEGVDGLVCVRFGMVTGDTDVEELLELVVAVGRRVQENSRVLETMAEIVKKGIETATADLQRETEEKLWSDGILRHVPVFGQVVNWWSPPVKETGIKGRSLNLTQGVVESTENIYKYHMQLAAHNQPIHGSKGPPTPLVQTSVSAGHSRNVSQGGSSTTSATVAPVPAPPATDAAPSTAQTSETAAAEQQPQQNAPQQ